MLKILCSSGSHQSFQIPPGIKSIYDLGKKHIHLLAGEAKLRNGEVISANLLAGEATGVHLTGVLGQGVSIVSAVGYYQINAQD